MMWCCCQTPLWNGAADALPWTCDSTCCLARDTASWAQPWPWQGPCIPNPKSVIAPGIWLVTVPSAWPVRHSQCPVQVPLWSPSRGSPGGMETEALRGGRLVPCCDWLSWNWSFPFSHFAFLREQLMGRGQVFRAWEVNSWEEAACKPGSSWISRINDILGPLSTTPLKSPPQESPEGLSMRTAHSCSAPLPVLSRSWVMRLLLITLLEEMDWGQHCGKLRNHLAKQKMCLPHNLQFHSWLWALETSYTYAGGKTHETVGSSTVG